MAYIKTLKDNELIGGVDNTDVYPISTSQAIFRQNPDGTIPDGIQHQRLEESLQDHEIDSKELHRKAERLVLSLDNDKEDQVLEITGNALQITLNGSAKVESFGDESAKDIAAEEMESKKLSIVSSGAIIEEDNNKVSGTYSLPNAVGVYEARFDCAYNGIEKHIENVTYVNLRKFFGFSDAMPTDVTSLDASDFSNTVECTVVVPAKDSGFKRIYFAVPNNMSINKVTQTSAFGAPLVIAQAGFINRTIGGRNYRYKLYQSEELIDSSMNKELTIQ